MLNFQRYGSYKGSKIHHQGHCHWTLVPFDRPRIISYQSSVVTILYRFRDFPNLKQLHHHMTLLLLLGTQYVPVLVRRQASRPRRHCVRWRPSSHSREWGTAASHFLVHVYYGQTVAHLSNC